MVSILKYLRVQLLSLQKKNVTSLYDQEHVTPFMKRSNKINFYNFKNKKDFSDMRVTLDYREMI